MKAADDKKRLELQVALEQEHLEQMRKAHEREDCGLEANLEEAESTRDRLQEALASSEAEENARSKSSSHAEKLLAEMKDECRELTEDRANYAKGMNNAN